MAFTSQQIPQFSGGIFIGSYASGYTDEKNKFTQIADQRVTRLQEKGYRAKRVDLENHNNANHVLIATQEHADRIEIIESIEHQATANQTDQQSGKLESELAIYARTVKRVLAEIVFSKAQAGETDIP